MTGSPHSVSVRSLAFSASDCWRWSTRYLPNSSICLQLPTATRTHVFAAGIVEGSEGPQWEPQTVDHGPQPTSLSPLLFGRKSMQPRFSPSVWGCCHYVGCSDGPRATRLSPATRSTGHLHGSRGSLKLLVMHDGNMSSCQSG
jgi:hypothetical protein